MPVAEHAVRQITAALAADPRLIAASLMGSALSSRFRSDSDVDVALLPKSGARLTALDLAGLAAPIEEAIGHPVHLGESSIASESCSPVNTTIDPGEVVTVSFIHITELRSAVISLEES